MLPFSVCYWYLPRRLAVHFVLLGCSVACLYDACNADLLAEQGSACGFGTHTGE